MKMIVTNRNREWFTIPRNLGNQFFAITFLRFIFVIVCDPAFPIADLPGILKNQATYKQQNGGHVSHRNLLVMVIVRKIYFLKQILLPKRTGLPGKGLHIA